MVRRHPALDPLASRPGPADSSPKPGRALEELGIGLSGANCLYGLLTNAQTKRRFLAQKYALLAQALGRSLLFAVDNSYVVPPGLSNVTEYQDKVQFEEMRRIFHANYQTYSRDALLVLLEDRAPFRLSEVGSVFGVKAQKSLFGFLNEKKEVFYLESPSLEVKLDLAYCRFSHGFIMKGDFVAVTGVLRGTKFVVFEMVVPQSGFFLDPDFRALTDQKWAGAGPLTPGAPGKLAGPNYLLRRPSSSTQRPPVNSPQSRPGSTPKWAPPDPPTSTDFSTSTARATPEEALPSAQAWSF